MTFAEWHVEKYGIAVKPTERVQKKRKIYVGLREEALIDRLHVHGTARLVNSVCLLMSSFYHAFYYTVLV